MASSVVSVPDLRGALKPVLVQHMARAPGSGGGLLIVGVEGAGRSTLLRTAYAELSAEGRIIYQVGPDPSGLSAPYYPIRSLLAAILALPPVSSEAELREAILGGGH